MKLSISIFTTLFLICVAPISMASPASDMANFSLQVNEQESTIADASVAVVNRAPLSYSLDLNEKGLVTISALNASDEEFVDLISTIVDAQTPLKIFDKNGVLSAIVHESALSFELTSLERASTFSGSKAFWNKKTFRAEFRWLWEAGSDPLRCTDITVRGGYAVALAYFTNVYPKLVLVSHLSVHEGGC